MKISWNKFLFNKLGCYSTPIPNTTWENLPLCPHLEHCLLSQGLSFIFQYPVILHDGLDFIQMCSHSTVTHLNDKFCFYFPFSTALVLPSAVCFNWFFTVHSETITGGGTAAIFSTIKQHKETTQLNTVQNVLTIQAFFKINYSGLFSSDWQTSLSRLFTVRAFKGPLKNKIVLVWENIQDVVKWMSDSFIHLINQATSLKYLPSDKWERIYC